jgi:hypothetical protein
MPATPIYLATEAERLALIDNMVRELNAIAHRWTCRCCPEPAVTNIISRFTRGDDEYAWCAPVCFRAPCGVYIQTKADEERDAVQKKDSVITGQQ